MLLLAPLPRLDRKGTTYGVQLGEQAATLFPPMKQSGRVTVMRQAHLVHHLISFKISRGDGLSRYGYFALMRFRPESARVDATRDCNTVSDPVLQMAG